MQEQVHVIADLRTKFAYPNIGDVGAMAPGSIANQLEESAYRPNWIGRTCLR